ncbi:MAG: class C sortase [Lachnospiraceae bacterium]|nr:class C sortase [Lachnospiraceae bacterium]
MRNVCTGAGKMERKGLKILVAAMFIMIGGGLMLYPFAANYVFEHRQESVIRTYEDAVSKTGEQEIAEMFAKAEEYNESLLRGNVQLRDPFTEDAGGYGREDYFSMLDVDGTGIMGYVSIPGIDVFLPVYHGTSEKVLENGIGHLEGTSLPVGGSGTHSVLTGHTGLSDAKLFTDLTLLEEGDFFFVTVLGEKLAYVIDQIMVVEPSDTAALGIEEGEDYCTLLTCTPYGINSHRLLVRGKRTGYTEKMEEVMETEPKAADSEWMLQYRRSLMFSWILIATAFAGMLLRNILRKKGIAPRNLKRITAGSR